MFSSPKPLASNGRKCDQAFPDSARSMDVGVVPRGKWALDPWLTTATAVTSGYAAPRIIRRSYAHDIA